MNKIVRRVRRPEKEASRRIVTVEPPPEKMSDLRAPAGAPTFLPARPTNGRGAFADGESTAFSTFLGNAMGRRTLPVTQPRR
ncbi:hypothetical protein EVAR_82529_1 [Eumeta japonica]|uniref:Uncharacterized protein n=1 Tax=Eumeta variegata TaxID=151549 RepID=A0A4C1UXQ3_EUMVA|nr:hypothetical protein EVAR_82529_1 [Eumeta japonica]